MCAPPSRDHATVNRVPRWRPGSLTARSADEAAPGDGREVRQDSPFPGGDEPSVWVQHDKENPNEAKDVAGGRVPRSGGHHGTWPRRRPHRTRAVPSRSAGEAIPVAECNGVSSLFTFEMRGSLDGCWYTTAIDVVQATSSGVYQERGTETFVGCLVENGVELACGTFDTTYKFSAKFAPDGSEIHGRCQHPLTGRQRADSPTPPDGSTSRTRWRPGASSIEATSTSAEIGASSAGNESRLSPGSRDSGRSQPHFLRVRRR